MVLRHPNPCYCGIGVLSLVFFEPLSIIMGHVLEHFLRSFSSLEVLVLIIAAGVVEAVSLFYNTLMFLTYGILVKTLTNRMVLNMDVKSEKVTSVPIYSDPFNLNFQKLYLQVLKKSENKSECS